VADQELRKLTDQEMAALGKEYPEFAEKVAKQTQEQIVFLRKHIAKDKKLDETQRDRLDRILLQNGFKVVLFRMTDANVLQKMNVQVTYDIHDELYEYLRRPDSELPRELRYFLEGGSVIDPKTNKPLAEDPSPQTGKTRTGVPMYDAILEQQRKLK
jgi:hypothetical protein